MLRFVLIPDGDMPIGALRIALINYIVAKQRNEGFILRVEDTDKARNIEGKDEETKQILEKFAIQSDQVIHQSEQLGRYQQLAVKLVEGGKAFLCICSEEDLERERRRAEEEKRPYRYSGRCTTMDSEEIRRIKEERIPFTIRIRKPAEAVTFDDTVRGEIRTDPGEVDHCVILRADGTPTQSFASACDDMMEGVSMVIREEDQLPETAKEIHIQRSLGYESGTVYAHLSPLLNEEGKKISKKDTAYTVKELMEEGFLPDAIINALLLPNTDTPEEIFTLPQAIERFDLKRFSSPARFDIESLRRLNREHLKRMDDLTLSRIFRFADAEVGRLVKLYLEEAATIKELDQRIHAVFSPKKCEGKWAEEMRILSALILEAPYFRKFDAFYKYLAKHSGLEGRRLQKSLRLLLTGTEEGPELNEIYPLIKSYITEIVRCQH